MRRIIKASMEDISSMERFQFSLRCAVCGFLWESQPVRFSKAGMQPESEGKRVIFQALYQREREDAFERAATEAMEYFSLCPICKRLVCDRCFLLGEDIDLCTDCAMVDGPGMMYTPEDQSPFAGSWQSRDGTIILEVESRGSLRRPAYRCL